VRGPLRIARLGGPKDREVFKKLSNSGITKLKKFVAGAQKSGFQNLPPLLIARASGDDIGGAKKKKSADDDQQLIAHGDQSLESPLAMITKADAARFKKLLGQSPYQAMRFLDAFQIQKPVTAEIALEQAQSVMDSPAHLSTTATEAKSVDITLRLKLDVDLTRESVRGTCTLPHAAASSARLLVFCPDSQAEEMVALGADFAGCANLVRRIAGGWTGFERCIATQAVMKDIVKVSIFTQILIFSLPRHQLCAFIHKAVSFDTR